MQITDNILFSFIQCHYKAYRKSKADAGCVSEYEKLYFQLKQSQKISFEKTLSEKKKLININTAIKDRNVRDRTMLDIKFSNANAEIILDGIEFIDKNKVIPILLTPYEKITKNDKLFISASIISPK